MTRSESTQNTWIRLRPTYPDPNPPNIPGSGSDQHTECPRINRKCVLHLLKHRCAVYLSRCSTDLRLLLGHPVSGSEFTQNIWIRIRQIYPDPNPSNIPGSSTDQYIRIRINPKCLNAPNLPRSGSDKHTWFRIHPTYLDPNPEDWVHVFCEHEDNFNLAKLSLPMTLCDSFFLVTFA